MTLRVDSSATIHRSTPGVAAADHPLTVVLHGYGASEHDLVPLWPYLGLPGETVFLRAPLALAQGGWAWFPLTFAPGDPALGARHSDLARATSAVLEWLEVQAGGREVVLIGFSQGGAVAVDVLRAAGERVAIRALAVLSGFVLPTPEGEPVAGATSRERLAATPVFFGHGSADQVVPAHLTAAASRWLAAHTALVEHSYPGLAHGVDERELADLRTFLARR